MLQKIIYLLVLTLVISEGYSQNVADFVSVKPDTQIAKFIFPSSTHEFQRIIEHADAISNGNMMDNFDFTAYVPISGSSTNGHLSINHELTVGGVTAMDIQYNIANKLWTKSNVTAIDFSSLVSISRPCSGGLTPYNTVVHGEEVLNTTDSNMDGYYDNGWLVESNPATKVAIQKYWAMGCGQKENVIFSANGRTAYFGNDASPGYLYKFVADVANDYSAGKLYAYQGSKSGSGNWILIPNTTKIERNTTMTLCASAGATVFSGVEDVEISPNGKIYLAVKNENQVYRFDDSDPITGTTVSNFETFVGNTSYNITHAAGTVSTPWGTGNDNLAFDNQGNLWVLQDGDNDYIWVVGASHTQAATNVKLFGISPRGSEPTGITFTPDYKFLFLSFQHPNSANNSDQRDAAGQQVKFDKDIAIVIALSQNLGCDLLGQTCNDGNNQTSNDTLDASCVCRGIPICSTVGQVCDDGNSETFNDTLDVSCICRGTQLQDTLTLSVAASSDDAEQNITSGVMDLNSSDLELVRDGTNQLVGIRFSNAGIPQGSQILSAHIQFRADESHNEATNLIIHGEKSSSSITFGTNINNSISSRIKTIDSVAWSNVPAWNTIGESGLNQKSPNLTSILQELVSQPNWKDTSAVTFIIKGIGKRVADSFDDTTDASKVPAQLIITYRILFNQNNVGIGTSTPASKLQVKDGDVFVESIGSGIIMKANNGGCWKIVVQNNGSLSTVSVPCPE
jgi:uncharacterized protein